MLDQAFAHCPIFPTAASRRSLGRVSVPVWLIILSDQLTIVALVGHYPANKLIVRRLLPRRLAPLTLGCHAVLAVVSHCYPPPGDRSLRVTHPSATAGCPAVRLACVRHAASVRSEPGSNSQVHHAPPSREGATTNGPRPSINRFRPPERNRGPHSTKHVIDASKNIGHVAATPHGTPEPAGDGRGSSRTPAIPGRPGAQPDTTTPSRGR